MMKRRVLVSSLILSAAIFQPAFADTTQLKQWIAPPECVVDGQILTQEECNKLLGPEQPVNPPTLTPEETADLLGTASLLEIPWLQISTDTTGTPDIRYVDRAETSSASRLDFIVSLLLLTLILIGAILIAFTSRRTSTNLSKEDKFDKMYRRVSSFWTRKAK